MTVTPGTRFGPYEIVSRIGAGGMGEVYRARDTRLDRSVAVKILPAELAGNAQFRMRFEREAKAISQLSHPHICTLYDVGDNYLVMELLEGETLAERLTRGPLSIDDVLRYGAEIADALDRAHRAGIIHRDLKPGNIMLTKSGAKLLDFGLAKASAAEAKYDGETLQKAMTQEGTILGTFQYMSPEQLDGQPADARSDLFALGAVLYEMATAKRAFDGKTRSSVIAAIVSGQPQPISMIQPVTPSALEHVVQKCLEKDPDDRWQSAHDVAEELRWVARESGREAKAVRRRGPAMTIAAALLAVLAMAATALYLRERAKPKERVAFAILAPRGYSIERAALSPDGRSVVIVGSDQRNDYALFVRRIEELEPRKLIASVYEHAIPYWSPDGAWLAYTDGLNLLRIPAGGGQPETIVRNAGYTVGLSWHSNGTILYCPHWGEGLFRVSAAGGEPVRVTKLDLARRESIHAWPFFLADGNRFLFLVRTVASQSNEIHAGSLDGKTRKMILRADSLVGVSKGALLFVREGALYAAPFDEKSLEVEGSPRRIAEGVAYQEDAATARATVSRDGALLFVPISEQIRRSDVAWHDRSGRLLEPLFSDTSLDEPRLSRDGTRLVLTKTDPKKGADDVYTMDLGRRILTKVTSGLQNHNEGIWSPDGSEVYYQSDRDGLYDVFAQSEDGSGLRTIWKNDKDKDVYDITPDGSLLICGEYDPRTKDDIWIVPARGNGAPKRIVGSEARERAARLSPDGRWLAYTVERSGSIEVYVRRFPDGRPVQVSTDGGIDARWRHDGSEIFFSNENKVQAVSVRVNGDALQLGRPVALFEIPRTAVAIEPSTTDDRFLIISAPDPADYVDVVHYVSGWN